MGVNPAELLALSAEEKLRIIELLWDDLGNSDQDIPLPGWALEEGLRRSDELRANPEIGLTHEEVWSRIDKRNEQT
jgi:putative addiction module component (TIGR02574 family)